jgi:hypothetical protein
MSNRPLSEIYAHLLESEDAYEEFRSHFPEAELQIPPVQKQLQRLKAHMDRLEDDIRKHPHAPKTPEEELAHKRKVIDVRVTFAKQEHQDLKVLPKCLSCAHYLGNTFTGKETTQELEHIAKEEFACKKKLLRMNEEFLQFCPEYEQDLGAIADGVAHWSIQDKLMTWQRIKARYDRLAPPQQPTPPARRI